MKKRWFMDNWCRFIQTERNFGDINVLHFVRETNTQIFNKWTTLSYYRLYFVISGTGRLHTQSGEYELNAGDIFSCAPALPYTLENLQDFECLYIGYMGTRANAILDKLNVYGKNCVFQGFSELDSLWKNAIAYPSEVLDLTAEGVLLYTFATIGARSLPKNNAKKEQNVLATIKKYVDDHFTDPELSLRKVGGELSYNANYVSAVFKNGVGISFKEYLNTLRIQNACALMEKGITGVKDVAFLCGFNDPLYFSKVFKARMGVNPSEHAQEIGKHDE